MSKDFLKKLVAFMQNADDLTTLREIEKAVDLDFVNGLSQWIRAQSAAADKPLTQGQVMSSISYWMALNIASTMETSQQICHAAQTYFDYVHNAAHAIQDGEAEDARKNKSP